jgi:hypothetical protein
MAADPQHKHVLFVTGPERERLFDHFSTLFRGRDDVDVRIDRRVGERRRRRGRPLDGERRRIRDRRVRPPDWMVPPGDGI